MFWKASEHPDTENVRWAWLRATEWGAFPAWTAAFWFPLVTLRWSLLTALLAVLFLEVPWNLLVRHRYVNLGLSQVGFWIAKLKWVSIPLVVFIFFDHGRYLEAIAIASCSYWMSIFVIIPVSARVGAIQTMFLKKIGYENAEELIYGDTRLNRIVTDANLIECAEIISDLEPEIMDSLRPSVQSSCKTAFDSFIQNHDTASARHLITLSDVALNIFIENSGFRPRLNGETDWANGIRNLS